MANETEANDIAVEKEERGFIGRIWNNMPVMARAGMILLSTLVLVAVIFLSLGRSDTEQMAVLFNRLDPAQAREVAAALDDMNVAYELDHEGTTILVPRDQRDRLRISMSPDLYAQGIGFALFENGGLVASDFERRAQWQIALEEELRRTITSLDSVDQARVHLVIPEEGLFIRERKDPSASVFLRLSPLTSLSDTQVRGILSLVAGSVERLRPENVTIVDSRGNVLYDAFAALDEMSVSNAVEENMRLKRHFETELEKRLRSILEQVYGPGKAVAMVSADLDFDAREQTSVAYENNPVSRSTHRIEERSDSMGAPAEEVGEPNVPGYAAVVGGGGESSYERIEEIVNYEVSETRQYIASAPGQVLRLSTAVIIDSNQNDPFMEEQVSELVQSAVGLNEARGDTVSVQLLPFDTSWIIEPGPEPVPPDSDQAAFPLLWAIIAGVVVLVAVLIAFFILRARARRREEEELDALSLEEELQSRVQADRVQAEPGEAEIKAKTIRDMAKEEPESVAGLLKTWLVED